MKKGILVYNPISHGGKYCKKTISCAKSIYEDHGVELILHPIDPKIGGFGNLSEKIREELPDHIVIAGGDGTLCNYLDFSKTNNISLPIGIIPIGTANDYAGSIGIDDNIEKAILQIINGKICPCDACSFYSYGKRGYFINVFSSGYLTCVSHSTPDSLKKRFGKMAYFMHGFKEALSPKKHKMTVTCDEKTYSGMVLLILVLNGNSAGRMIFAKDADISDGLLDVRIFTGQTILGTLATAIRVFLGLGLRTTKDMICIRGKHISIDGEKHETDIDGDRGPSYPVEIECLKGTLQIIL